MASEPTEVDVGGTTVQPPQDEAQNATWIDEFTENGSALWQAWQQTELQYNIMMAQRARWGYPKFDEAWTPAQDDQFWQLHYAVMKITSYVSEVDKRVRAVAYDPSIKSVVALATVGEPSFSTENGELIVKMGGSEQVRISSTGLVNAVPWNVVAAIAIAAATVGTAYFITQAYKKHIESVQASDLQKHTIEVCTKYGAEACPKILASETDQIIKTELAKAEANRGSDAWAISTAIKYVSIAATVLAIGGAAWYFWPRSKREHNPKKISKKPWTENQIASAKQRLERDMEYWKNKAAYWHKRGDEDEEAKAWDEYSGSMEALDWVGKDRPVPKGGHFGRGYDPGND